MNLYVCKDCHRIHKEQPEQCLSCGSKNLFSFTEWLDERKNDGRILGCQFDGDVCTSLTWQTKVVTITAALKDGHAQVNPDGSWICERADHNHAAHVEPTAAEKIKEFISEWYIFVIAWGVLLFFGIKNGWISDFFDWLAAST
ncbi:MAG: hypothetical protein IE913_00615 [Halothiobacillus sp.]|nr:hypothetical protein [Halothiobacillus sp.]